MGAGFTGIPCEAALAFGINSMKVGNLSIAFIIIVVQPMKYESCVYFGNFINGSKYCLCAVEAFARDGEGMCVCIRFVFLRLFDKFVIRPF